MQQRCSVRSTTRDASRPRSLCCAHRSLRRDARPTRLTEWQQHLDARLDRQSVFIVRRVGSCRSRRCVRSPLCSARLLLPSSAAGPPHQHKPAQTHTHTHIDGLQQLGTSYNLFLLCGAAAAADSSTSLQKSYGLCRYNCGVRVIVIVNVRASSPDYYKTEKPLAGDCASLKYYYATYASTYQHTETPPPLPTLRHTKSQRIV